MLYQTSGHINAEARNNEAIKIFQEFYAEYSNWQSFKEREIIFMQKLKRMYEFKNRKVIFVSPKELFWLRDLKEKYL